jgi:CheY-like chemotaxis protein
MCAHYQHQGCFALTMTNLSHITHFGLPGIDRIPFGMHACHFYSNRNDLVRALVPYFVAGINANERCLWVTAPPLSAREADQALRAKGVKDAIQAGALRILAFDEWYANTTGLKGLDVVQVWLDEEERALAEGYSGLRIAGNMSFLKPDEWSAFIEYEKSVTVQFKSRRIVALCSYALPQCNDQQMSDVRHAHYWSLQGSDTDWKWVEPSQFPKHGITERRNGIASNSQAPKQLGSTVASAATIRVLIADDHPVMRYTLRSVLKQYPEIDIVGEATNGEEAVLRAEEFQPAIVLMDINMPKLDGISATQRIKANPSLIGVIGLSFSGEGHLIDAMLKAGAVAVVQKEKAIEHLYDAIQRAIADRSHIHSRQS